MCLSLQKQHPSARCPEHRRVRQQDQRAGRYSGRSLALEGTGWRTRTKRFKAKNSPGSCPLCSQLRSRCPSRTCALRFPHTRLAQPQSPRQTIYFCSSEPSILTTQPPREKPGLTSSLFPPLSFQIDQHKFLESDSFSVSCCLSSICSGTDDHTRLLGPIQVL